MVSKDLQSPLRLSAISPQEGFGVGDHTGYCLPADTANERRITELPVLSTYVLVLSIDSSIHKNTHDDEDDDSNDFQKAKPIFKLAVDSNRQKICTN